MAKKQLNFRIEENLLELIQKQADSEGTTVTEWLHNAALTQLGIREKDDNLILYEDRLEKVEADLESCQKGLQEVFNKLNIRMDELWDTIDYVADGLEEDKQNQKAYIKDCVRRYILALQYRMKPRDLENLESISEINEIADQAEDSTQRDLKDNPMDKK